MRYTAVNTKIRAMQSGAELEKICCYLPKNARDFLRKFADGFRFAENYKNLAALDKSSRESLRRIIRAETTLRNVLKIYRLKGFYNLHGDAVLPYLSPICDHAAEITRLAHTKSLNEFLREAENKFPLDEKALAHAVLAAFKKEYRHGNLAVTCGFLYERYIGGLQNGRKNEIHKHNGAYFGHGARD